jgi:signal transduction histidine kinase
MSFGGNLKGIRDLRFSMLVIRLLRGKVNDAEALLRPRLQALLLFPVWRFRAHPSGAVVLLPVSFFRFPGTPHTPTLPFRGAGVQIVTVSHLRFAGTWTASQNAVKIKVDLDIPDEFRRLSDEMEIAIFRMIQECLTNIHRHSGGTTAAIRAHEQDLRVLIEVQDNGKGIPLERQLELSSSGRAGVGFRGMRERLRQLGGNLEIRSNGEGTLVIATLPLLESKDARTASEEIAS